MTDAEIDRLWEYGELPPLSPDREKENRELLEQVLEESE